MFLLLYMGIAITVYVLTFKNDFEPEQLEKAAPFIFITSGLFILIGIVGSIVGR